MNEMSPESGILTERYVSANYRLVDYEKRKSLVIHSSHFYVTHHLLPVLMPLPGLSPIFHARHPKNRQSEIRGACSNNLLSLSHILVSRVASLRVTLSRQLSPQSGPYVITANSCLGRKQDPRASLDLSRYTAYAMHSHCCLSFSCHFKNHSFEAHTAEEDLYKVAAD